MVGWDQDDPGEKFIAFTGLFAGKLAPTGSLQSRSNQ
ncbi:hypothetical protein STW0522PSE72_07180 [Pseudomonas monteilii]|nr:hypothetical protein STW0522PSE72_07180 [Pseudomonas monteilii]